MIIKDLFEKKIDRSIEGVVTIGNSLGAIAFNELIKASKRLFSKNDQKSA